ncbi:MAG: NAD-dependent epimerase/dehydratase family protein [Pseudomonas marincola]
MTEQKIDTQHPVMVTGATGYVAGWIVKELLEAGCIVHAPVRDPDNAEKLAHLNAIAVASKGKIKFFKADLMEPGSYAAAMKGCGTVFHTASPFTLDVKNPQIELIDPALNGTKNVLDSVNSSKSVKRVALTSSCAAIYADAKDCASAPDGMLTEDIWNTTASLEHQPYSYSKTVAEKAAWEIANAQDRWDLVTINPSFVMGPPIGGKPTSESFNFMQQLGDGAYKTGAPRFGIGVVDVRDVAKAHMAAAFIPRANGRHITSGHATDIFEMFNVLKDQFGKDYGIPKSAAPKFLVWLIGPFMGIDRKVVSNNVNHVWKADTSKSINELGISYHPLKQTMEDMFQYMIDAGFFEKKGGA